LAKPYFSGCWNTFRPVGAAVLVGWRLGYLPLIQLFPSVAAPMQRMTAFGFLLCGMALVFENGTPVEEGSCHF
jgi:hypothetical protein